MKRATAAGLGIATVAAALLAFYFLRHHDADHGSEQGSDPWATQPGSASGSDPATRARRTAMPGGQGGGGEQPVLVDDDPKGTLRLEGQVLGDGDKGVAGAIVVLSSNPPRTAKSEDDGSFAFDALVARPYTLTARAPAGVAGPITAKLTASSEPVILRLRPAGALEVTVVDPKQQPVGGATVELRGIDEQSAPTEASGVARFAPVVPGGYDVVASAPGYAPSSNPLRVTEGTTQLKVQLARGAKVSGKVVDDTGAPVGGARVVYSGASDWATQGDPRLDGVETGKDGRFEFAALPPGSFRFVARHPDHAPGTSSIVTLDGIKARDGVEIRLPPGATVRGKVVDGQGGPVASARVRVGLANAGFIGEGPRQVYSDDHGEFVVRGLARRPLTAVAIGDTAASDSVPVDTSKGDVGGVVLKLDVTGTIAGVVVDDGGKPLEGVQVSAFPDFRSQPKDGQGGATDMANWRLRGFPMELTDSAGHFTLSGLAKGTYRVRATRSRHAQRGRGFAGEGTSAETGTTNLRIVLPPEGAVKGKVLYADGTAPGPFTVGVGFMQQPVAASDGSFLLDGLTPDHYTVSIHGNGFVPASAEVDVKGGETADVGTITVEKGRTIAGKVIAQGQPVPGATVYAGGGIFGNGSTSDARMGGGGPPMAQNTRSTTTGDDGSFSFSGFGQADVTIVAEEATLGRSLSQRIMPGDPNEQTLVLEIVPPGALHGVLRSGGKPAENVIVTAQSASGTNAIYSVATGPDGAYRFDRLTPDTYKVSAMVTIPMRGMKFYSKQIQLASGQDLSLDLQYDPGAVTLAVTATPQGGKPGLLLMFIASGQLVATTNRELQQKLAALGDSTSQINFVPFGVQTKFTELDPGPYTVCAVALPSSVAMQAAMSYMEAHGDVLPVTCRPVAVAASPAEQAFTIAVTVPPDPSGSGKGSGAGSGAGKSGG